ncbi:MAG: mechanosensitive ion channel family protein [Mariprofundaceae bacterium]|nr:mechanosensitive ion channel family protein [Mariprofundaceae bacterium]
MSELWNSVQNWTLLDIAATRWLLAAVALFLVIVTQRLVVRGFHALTHSIAARTDTELDDVLLAAAGKPVEWLILVIGLLMTVHLLNPPVEVFPLVPFANYAGRVVSIILGAWFIWRLVDGFGAYFSARAAQSTSALDDQLVPFVAKTLKIFLILTGVLVVAQNMGYSVSGLIASLGIGGIAVAMAAKDTIANVFGSIMLLIDRPFIIGNWIKTSEFEGVVEEIGFRSTRIRTFAKTVVNVPNSMLANMVIDNIDARPKRRVKIRISVTYDTTPAQMQQAITGIENILKSHIGVDQEFSLVKFDEFEDSSLSIFLYYFTNTTHWEEYLQIRQEVNMQIMELLEKLEVEFAFPTRTVHLQPSDIVETETQSTGNSGG